MITSDLQSSASGQTVQDLGSEIHPRTEIYHEQSLGKVEESQSRSITSSSDQWLLLCFHYDKHVSKAAHMEVGEDSCDEKLLFFFKKEYVTARGWAIYYLSWTAVTSIRFVRFLIIREDKNSSFDYGVEDDIDGGRENEEENGEKVILLILRSLKKNGVLQLSGAKGMRGLHVRPIYDRSYTRNG